MKRVLFAALIGSICLTTSACAGSSLDSTALTDATTIQEMTEVAIETTKGTEKPTEASTEEHTTDAPTEESTTADTKQGTIGYSAVELADKSLSEIIDVMGGDFEVDNGQKHLIHYTSPPARNIYNDETLPGFVFFVEPKEGVAYDQLAEDTDFDGVKADALSGKLEIAFIGLFDNAKYDENISVGMSYVDISEATGSYELALVAGSSAMRQAIAYTDNRKTPGATVYYEYTEGLKMGIKDVFGVYDEEEAKKYDPNSWGIVVFPDK